MPKYLIQTIQTYRMDYVIEAKEESHALDEVACCGTDDEILEEISQEHLGELIIESRELTDEEYIKFFDKHNSYLKHWTPELKMKKIHIIKYPDDGDSND